jgi:hypothetical protein
MGEGEVTPELGCELELVFDQYGVTDLNGGN